MEPALTESRLIIASSLIKPRIGRVAIIKHDGMEKVKRIAMYDSGRLYLLGDNAKKSTDSRHFGWVDGNNLLGIVLWPRTKKKIE